VLPKVTVRRTKDIDGTKVSGEEAILNPDPALDTPRAAFGLINATETGCDERRYLFGGMTVGATETEIYEVIDQLYTMGGISGSAAEDR
jgi:hypothetical protein